MVNSSLIATLYVNPATGKDSNTGSRLNPLKSITCALKQAKTSTIIQLANGTYGTANGEVFPLIIPPGVLVVGNEANKGQEMIISGSGEYQSSSFGLQNITLLLRGDASLLGVTVINTIAKGTGVWIESSVPTVANSTFKNCAREGIFTTGNAKPGIMDNLFINNQFSGLVMARNSKGEVLRNVFQNNPLGIAISDLAAPLLANNQLSANGTAIALARDARPVLRRNLIASNTQVGLLVNGNAVPDLGNPQDPADNIFREQGKFDLQNFTNQKIISVGNQLNPARVMGSIDFITATVNTPSQIGVSSRFADLEGHWSAAFVEALVSKGFISGFPDGTFQPASPITRAQYAAVITKTFQLPESNQLDRFKDVKSNFWAAKAIASAADNDFFTGFPNGTFRPENNLTKIQALVSIVNGLKLSGGNPNILMLYRDRAQIPSYATKTAAVATQNLLVVNYPQPDQLEPLREITRAEVAALIYQALVAIGAENPLSCAYIVKPETEIPSFSDLVGHWAEPFIRALVSMNLTQGFADGTYQPDEGMTRAQYTALIATAFNPPAKRPSHEFTDIPKDFWAAKAIEVAARGGFVGGFSDRTFRPQQKVQRLQIIVSLVNGLGLSATNQKTLIYKDQNKIPEYAQTAVTIATQQKIIVNYPDPNLLAPTREATRAEVAAMVYQALVASQRTKIINSPYIVLQTSN
ncbi:S-layer homology domain-containing protein [Dolichospermum circinale]|uniref:S-layer homology domain-containing protein n=1 Tax=Dolichospermum circinale TaxID=109265 RepID=UPI00232C6B87|nr:S-layer homology domain-containing protein [Dolichospermum circinale]MDB9453585.1 S-layer homology domain-containing protein [Dolichospermum circinale CS-541/06]MDB9464253.1 S-layer homology domain-containing protein [Dolichospermum circinale CS-541/04]MDB9547229.1 S-layer homology domain-containing protein [Dolichospermum circinale CS-1031]